MSDFDPKVMEAMIADRISLTMAEKLVLSDEIGKMKTNLYRFSEAVEDGDAKTMGRLWQDMGAPVSYIGGILQHKAQEAAAEILREQQGGGR